MASAGENEVIRREEPGLEGVEDCPIVGVVSVVGVVVGVDHLESSEGIEEDMAEDPSFEALTKSDMGAEAVEKSYGCWSGKGGAWLRSVNIDVGGSR